MAHSHTSVSLKTVDSKIFVLFSITKTLKRVFEFLHQKVDTSTTGHMKSKLAEWKNKTWESEERSLVIWVYWPFKSDC